MMTKYVVERERKIDCNGDSLTELRLYEITISEDLEIELKSFKGSYWIYDNGKVITRNYKFLYKRRKKFKK